MTGLFEIAEAEIKVTTDDCYTPAWVFAAMDLEFDLDVAAPVGGPWHVPCQRYFTAADDGLAQPWDGLVWCNPPWSRFGEWAERYVRHDRAVIMGLCLAETLWFPQVLRASDAVTFAYVEFHRNGTGPKRNQGRVRFRQPVFVAFRGVGTEPAERLARADPYGAVLYGRAAA